MVLFTVGVHYCGYTDICVQHLLQDNFGSRFITIFCSLEDELNKCITKSI